MTDHVIITIGREFGSGGHEIGNRLAERLNIPLYDHNLIAMAARKLAITNEEASQVDESILGKFLSGYVVNTGDYTVFMREGEDTVPLSDKVFRAQKEIILELAKRSSCIFVGRCADYILGDYSNCINVFVHAYRDDRVRRIMQIYKLDERQAKEKIKRVDKGRKLYYEAHTGREWGSIESHDILLNVSLLGVEGTVDALESIYRKWEQS
ncbi:cytidylate kinase-like family protein [Coprococcus sp. AF21-14LB]|uniref:cytidylate kinase-like family protein n=1 Tax=Coprococcus sp. AF21-14LB TaxID=2292231 RepID=UPI000E4727BF|nr:cytidylate kinase-like family protein [Coprococcus sp. AF21-14LB]QUO33241.1 cytidylate kinase-like family protein [Faecalicatena sp. Marseille-Q4148]RGS78104.1 cytidylate kinase-like family protein [Coprococcus sp. AF21-14LB]